MEQNVADFIAWWSALSREERRLRIAQARERKSQWLSRRADTLFGILEDDAMFNVLGSVDGEEEDG